MLQVELTCHLTSPSGHLASPSGHLAAPGLSLPCGASTTLVRQPDLVIIFVFFMIIIFIIMTIMIR